MSNWQIGDVTVSRVVELQFPMPIEGLLAGVNTEKLAEHAEWLIPDYMQSEKQFLISVHALIIRSQGKVIVVDTCMGNDRSLPHDFGPLETNFLSDFEAVISRDEVDYVMCTHMHFDHIGWNTMLVDEKWVPTFPNARYLFARHEFEHWQTDAAGEDSYIDFRYAIEPIIEKGLHDLVESNHQITPEVSLQPTPGHTPGHVSVRIRSKGEEAIITGDMIHSPVQLFEPDWSCISDSDAQVGNQTRQRLVKECTESPVLIIGTHFSGTSAGRLVKTGDKYQFQGE